MRPSRFVFKVTLEYEDRVWDGKKREIVDVFKSTTYYIIARVACVASKKAERIFTHGWYDRDEWALKIISNEAVRLGYIYDANN